MLEVDLSNKAAGVLDDVRVIDMATVLAGPGAARYLADYGADVIKVERPGGDATRQMGWTVPGEQDSLIWKLANRGKRAISIDLSTPAGVAEMRQLLDGADVLVENMRPGKLEALGLGPDVLWNSNPRLVVLRVSGFGQDGPYAQRPGFATIAEAMSGFSGLLGEPDGPPLLPPIALTDELTALVGAFAAMLALRHAERTGHGQLVDVNLLESVLQIMGPLPAAWVQMSYLQPRLGAGIPYTVPRGTYRCSDGVWVAVSASSESAARRLMDLLGLADDPRFAAFQGRSQHREELERLTREWVAGRPSAEVLERFAAMDAAIAPIYSMADVVQDPQIVARGALVDVEGMAMQNVVARLSRSPGRIRSVGPTLDAHAAEIRKELADRTGSTGHNRPPNVSGG